MKYTIDYVPPFNRNYLPKDSDDLEWAITAMTIYRPRNNKFTNEACNGSYQLFWPLNPWESLEKLSVDFLSK